MKKTFSISTLFNRYIKLFVTKGYDTSKKVEPLIGSRKNSMAYNLKKKINKRMNNLLILGTVKRYALWAIVFIIGISSVKAQDTLQVNGKILNVSNEPVSNVSVAVEGSFELPVVTGEDGEFTVKVLTGKEWLNVSPPSGYKGKRVKLNNREELTIYLADEDLATGYDEISVLKQERLKRNMVSAHSVVDITEIRQTPAISVDEYMQGRTPGLHIVNRSGDPASGAFTLFRGINSLNTSNQPLYVVDGIPVISMGVFESNLDGFSYNPLVGVNPMDISRTTVIKDPTLAAAYGSKASNGIVMIETLAPTATETVIDLDLRSGYSLSPSRLIPQLDAGQHRTLASEVLFSSGDREEEIRENYPGLFIKENSDRFIDYNHNTNWQNNIFSNAAFSSINVNVKGGDEIARYGLSFGYMNADGIIKTTGYDGYNLRFVSLLNIFSWLKMDAGVSLSYNTSQLKESAKVDQTNPILASLGKSPLLNPYQYDEDGNEIKTLAPVNDLGVSNPQAVIDNYEAQNTNFYFITQLGFEATLKENLVLNTNFGITYNLLKEQIFMPNQGMELYYNQEALNVSKASNNSLSSIYNNTYLKFDKTFGGDHHFTSNTGVNILTNDFEFDWGLTKNAPASDHYRFLNDGTANLRELGGANRNWNWLSVYENITYSYMDKYLASASVSIDGSSRIGDNARNTLNVGGTPFGLFYAGGVGWRISSEPFMNNLSWLEELKFRLTYGVSGNDDIGESTASNYYETVKFRETAGLYPALIPNDELTYETVKQTNLGMDISILGDRITATVDLYSSETNDMLIYSPMEAYFGYDFRPENSGKMQNKGIDLGVFMRIVNRPNFKWDMQAAWSTMQNEVLEIKGDRLVTGVKGAEIVNMPGEQANSFYGYIFEGVYSTSEEAENAGLVNNRRLAYQAGDAIFADISGPDGEKDGVIDNYDKTVIGSSLPEQFGGLNNKFIYKRWALSTFLQFVYGNEIFNYVRFQNENMAGIENQSTDVLNRWQYEGHDTDVPRALWEDPIGNSAFSSRWIEDGSYLRIKNISLSYTIPDEFLAFRNAQFYVSAANVFTFSKYLGYDPEFGYSHSQIDQGIDYGLTPQPRQFFVGIKLGL